MFGLRPHQVNVSESIEFASIPSSSESTEAAADAALADGGYDALDAFVNDGGYANARYADQLQQAYYLVETGGPEVKAAAEAAVAGDRSMLNEFIMIEQYRRASLDSYRATHTRILTQ